MKKIIYLLFTAFLFSACNSGLDKSKVEEFVINHFTSGNESAQNGVMAMSNNIGDSVMLYNLSNGWIGRPEWVNDNSKIKLEWFYEDSANVEVSDIEVFGPKIN